MKKTTDKYNSNKSGIKSSAKNFIMKIIPLIFIVFLTNDIFAEIYDGYILYSPNNSRYSYLLDMNKTVVHSWTHSKTGGYSCYLLEDGSLMRSATSSNSQLNGGGALGVIQK